MKIDTIFGGECVKWVAIESRGGCSIVYVEGEQLNLGGILRGNGAGEDTVVE